MEMQAVKSSSVNKLGWEDEVLAVEYISGGTYHYMPVPKSVFDTIMTAPSIGQFVHKFLKMQVGKLYTCKKVK